MATNIEIKAKVDDLAALHDRVAAISDAPGELIVQEDTFFHAPRGRLKLRVFNPHLGRLIYYERADSAAPKRSDYLLSTTTEPRTLKAVLSAALEVRGIVKKRRMLYHVGNTRIHLDEVEGLGSFMELEVVLFPNQTAQQGEAIAVELMAKLGIEKSDLVDVAYIDLLENHRVSGTED